MFALKYLAGFVKSYKKIIKGNSILEKQFLKTLKLLKTDPQYPSLQSHKVDVIGQNDVWVSRVSGDVRIAWFYDEDQHLIINCIKLGTHGGANQIYNNKSN
jgi:mRNA-degrading endonuclease YafQ of YafQ-DinJ toxin-antitoxin module